MTHYLFTDPACLGPDYFTASGDVDDIACMIYMSQKLKDKLLIVVCDDDDNQNRFHSTHNLLTKLKRIYDISMIPESSLSSTHHKTSSRNNKPFSPPFTIHIHSSINSETVDFLFCNMSSIETVHRQGDDSSTNFINSPDSIRFCKELQFYPEKKLVTHSTSNTFFTIQKADQNSNFKSKTVKKVYDGFFDFEFRKYFAPPLSNYALTKRLYSDCGGTFKKFLPLIRELKETKLWPGRDGVLEALKASGLLDAIDKTFYNNEKNSDLLMNIYSVVFILNLYCNYSGLLVDGRIPNMAELRTVGERQFLNTPKNISKHEIGNKIRLFFEGLNKNSTGLFDFTAGVFALESENLELNCIKDKLFQCLHQFDVDLKVLP